MPRAGRRPPGAVCLKEKCMYLCNQWRDYEVLDTGDGEKLERWGNILLRRPDPQVIWPKARPELWKKCRRQM